MQTKRDVLNEAEHAPDRSSDEHGDELTNKGRGALGSQHTHTCTCKTDCARYPPPRTLSVFN